ncbi:MAG: PQQ-binding-like beta-propeller repeat protein [Actinomycetota bacterium]
MRPARSRVRSSCLGALIVVSVIGSGHASADDPAAGAEYRHSEADSIRTNASQAAFSPDGSRLYLTGIAEPSTTSSEFLMMAFDTASRQPVWTRRHRGTGVGFNLPQAMLLSPDGANLFVAGATVGSDAASDFTTLALDPATGEERWIAYAPGDVWHTARAMAMSSDGASVIVVGTAYSPNQPRDMLVIGYDAIDGQARWSRTIPGSSLSDGATSVVSRDGVAYVTGQLDLGLAVAAIDESDGSVIWFARGGAAGNSRSLARNILVTPDGTSVVASGVAYRPPGGEDFITVALDSETGVIMWESYLNEADLNQSAYVSEISAEDGTVIVAGTGAITGTSSGDQGFHDYVVTAYDLTDGTERWRARYDGPGSAQDRPMSVTVLPDMRLAVVTGFSAGEAASGYDWATIGVELDSGAIRWVNRYAGAGMGSDLAREVIPGPEPATFIVAGSSTDFDGRSSALAIGYRIGVCPEGSPENGPLSGPLHHGVEPLDPTEQVHEGSCLAARSGL